MSDGRLRARGVCPAGSTGSSGIGNFIGGTPAREEPSSGSTFPSVIAL